MGMSVLDPFEGRSVSLPQRKNGMLDEVVNSREQVGISSRHDQAEQHDACRTPNEELS